MYNPLVCCLLLLQSIVSPILHTACLKNSWNLPTILISYSWIPQLISICSEFKDCVCVLTCVCSECVPVCACVCAPVLMCECVCIHVKTRGDTGCLPQCDSPLWFLRQCLSLNLGLIHCTGLDWQPVSSTDPPVSAPPSAGVTSTSHHPGSSNPGTGIQIQVFTHWAVSPVPWGSFWTDLC